MSYNPETNKSTYFQSYILRHLRGKVTPKTIYSQLQGLMGRFRRNQINIAKVYQEHYSFDTCDKIDVYDSYKNKKFSLTVKKYTIQQ